MRPGALLAVALASLLLATPASAEDAKLASDRDEFLAERRGLMIGLGSWAVASATAGAILLATSPRGPDRDRRVFRQSMGSIFLAYALINGALAVGTLAGIEHQRESLRTPTAFAGTRRFATETFAANALLDVVYVATGGMLWQNAHGALARGAGAGIVVQGGFLVAFDSLGASLYVH